MDKLDFEFFQDGNIPRQKPPRGYEWQVVVDPTRNEDHPGLFYGHHFRIFDIRPYPGEPPSWPDGIVFQHIGNGRRLAILGGKLVKNRAGQEKPDFQDLS